MSVFYLLSLLLFSNFALADQPLTLPVARDFVADGRHSNATQKPILVMISIKDCSYCAQVKSEVLSPMAQMSEYQEKIIIRHIRADTLRDLRGFDAKPTNHGQFAFRYNVRFYPTILLLNSRGTVLNKMIGVVSLDNYWTDLDEKIKQARAKLQPLLSTKL